MKIDQLKKELGLKNKDIAEFFGLSAGAYANSSAKERYEKALCNIYVLIKRLNIPDSNRRELFDEFYEWLDGLSQAEYDDMSLTDKCEKFFFSSSFYHQNKVKNLDIPRVINWVAITERLPEEEWGDYMVCLENNAIFKANYSRIGTERWLIVGVGDTKETNPVKYWAELPEPPCL